MQATVCLIGGGTIHTGKERGAPYVFDGLFDLVNKERRDIKVLIIGSNAEKAEESAVGTGKVMKRFGLDELNIYVYAPTTHDEALKSTVARELYYEYNVQLATLLKEVDIVYFTGGQQALGYSILKDSYFVEQLKKQAEERDFIIAGTSAGATILGTHIVYDGASYESSADANIIRDNEPAVLKVGEGLGILRRIAPDTHFLERSRIPRLTTDLAYNLLLFQGNSATLGVGVDEDTMAIITADNRMKVFGSHNVTVIGIANSTIGYATTYGVKRIIVQDPLIHNLTHEGEFDMQTRSKVLPEGFVPVYQQGFPLNFLSGNDRS